ncbi:MAG: 50S ribosomal protein L29 [Acidimicrobiales bacterium]|jgi:large subunit ribosomal protein L29
MATGAELRELDDDELDNRLTNARKELFNLRFQAATGRLDNSARTGAVRRDIARMLTVIRDRELTPVEEPAASVASGRITGGGRRRRRNEEE